MPQKKRQASAWVYIVPLMLVGAVLGGYFWYRSQDRLHTMMKVPAFELTNQHGQKISDKTMLGKVYLVEFFFSTCPTICPVMNSNMKSLQVAVPSNDFGIISISIDPEHDTPAVLQAHAKKIRASSPNWHFLTGDRTYIGQLADQFNIYVGKQTDKAESLNHSGMIALVDKKGYLRCRYDEKNMPILYYSGLNYSDSEGKQPDLRGKYHPDIEKLKTDIQLLLKE